MKTGEMITVTEYCVHYNIKSDFIHSLHEAGLIAVTTIDQESYISYEQLNELEKFTRLHHDLNINTEGIEAISHILQKMEDMQQEITKLQSRLSIYEQ